MPDALGGRMTITDDSTLVRRPWTDLPGACLDLRPRRVRERFVLVSGGTARADLVVPDSPEAAAAASALADTVRQLSGVSLPVAPARWPDDSWAPARGPGTLANTKDRASGGVRILLGSLSTNPLLAALYHASLCPVDGRFPGPGGQYLRTLCDPWADGVDLVIVGTSRDQDLLAATETIARRLEGGEGEVSLGYVHDVAAPRSPVCGLLQDGSIADAGQLMELGEALEDDERVRERARHAYRTRAHRGYTPYLSRAALAFNLTGEERFARQYLALFHDMMEDVAVWEPDQWGRWGFDADFQAVQMVSGWHAISDSPVFSDRDRQHIAAHMVQYLGNNEDEWNKHKASPYPSRQNHFTFASLGLVYGALTLCRTHGLSDTEARWLSMADECFGPQVTATKPAEDCDSYGWHTLSHTLRYALLRPVQDYFKNGTCARVMERGLVAMDNLGCQVPYGDARAHLGSGSEFTYWRPAAWVLGSPRYVAAAKKKDDLASLPPVYGYDVPRDGRAGEISLPVVTVAELDPSYLATYPDPAPEDGFDKIALRDTLSPEAPYLLIDGVGNGSHGHRDANAMVRFTSRNRIWLEDADYDKTAPHFHNTVVVTRNGIAGRLPAYARLAGVAQDENAAIVRTALDGLAGAGWLRTTVWIRGIGILLVDRVVAETAGSYEVAALWRTVGDAHLEGGTFVVSMPPETLRILSRCARGRDATRRLLEERFVRADWDTYPYAQDHVTVNRVSVEKCLEAQEDIVLVHLLVDRPGPIGLRTVESGHAQARVGDQLIEIHLERLCEGNLDAITPPVRQGWWVPAAPGAPATLVDLDGDGSDELIVGSSRGLSAYRGSDLLWSVPTIAPVTAVGSVEGGAIIAGQAEGNVELFGADGSRRWHRTFPGHMGHPPNTRRAFGAQLGRPAVVIATESCHVHAFGLDGTELWRRELVHAATDATAGDLDGDGNDEVLAGTEYWTWHCIDTSGTPRFTVRGVEASGCGAVAAWTTCQKPLALFGGWDGHLSAYHLSGDLAWDVALGAAVTAIEPTEAGAVVTLGGGRICCVSERGVLRWNLRFPNEVSALRWIPEIDVFAVATGDEIAGVGADGVVCSRDSLEGGTAADLRRCAHQGAAGLAVTRSGGPIEWLPASVLVGSWVAAGAAACSNPKPT